MGESGREQERAWENESLGGRECGSERERVGERECVG